MQVEPEKVLAKFQRLSVALVDASSIIYMVKAGFFELAAENLELHSTQQVIEETGYQRIRVRTLEAIDLPPDRSLLHYAERLKWPVITEDKGIIKDLQARQLRFFNALLVLEYLSFRKLLGPEDYSRCSIQLLACAHYGCEIIKFARAVHRVFDPLPAQPWNRALR